MFAEQPLGGRIHKAHQVLFGKRKDISPSRILTPSKAPSKSSLVFQQNEATFSNGPKFRSMTNVGKNFNQVLGHVTLVLYFLLYLIMCS